MKANPAPRDSLSSDRYARRVPFHHLVDIVSHEKVRPGVRIPEADRLGRLGIFPPCEAAMEDELPYAYHEMLQRASRLVVRPVEVTRLGTTRTVYVVVAEDEADEKVSVFAEYANHAQITRSGNEELIRGFMFWNEFLGEVSSRTLGWWALGYQVAWTLSAEAAQRVIAEGFQPVDATASS